MYPIRSKSIDNRSIIKSQPPYNSIGSKTWIWEGNVCGELHMSRWRLASLRSVWIFCRKLTFCFNCSAQNELNYFASTVFLIQHANDIRNTVYLVTHSCIRNLICSFWSALQCIKPKVINACHLNSQIIHDLSGWWWHGITNNVRYWKQDAQYDFMWNINRNGSVLM